MSATPENEDRPQTDAVASRDAAPSGSGGSPASAEPSGQAAKQATLKVDDSKAVAGYANFCRVSSTPEELILDLGLNPRPYGEGETTVEIDQRIILNHYTAKRLLNALSLALQRHEQAFGVLETDVRKRVRKT